MPKNDTDEISTRSEVIATKTVSRSYTNTAGDISKMLQGDHRVGEEMKIKSPLRFLMQAEGWGEFAMGSDIIAQVENKQGKITVEENGLQKEVGSLITEQTVTTESGYQCKYTLQQEKTGELKYHAEERDPDGRLLCTYNLRLIKEKREWPSEEEVLYLAPSWHNVKIYWNPANGLRSDDEAKPLYRIEKTDGVGIDFAIYTGPDGIVSKRVWVIVGEGGGHFYFRDGREERREENPQGGVNVTTQSEAGDKIVRYTYQQEQGKTVFTYKDGATKTFTFDNKNGVITNDVITVKERKLDGTETEYELNKHRKPANVFKRAWNALVNFFRPSKTITPLDALLKQEKLNEMSPEERKKEEEWEEKFKQLEREESEKEEKSWTENNYGVNYNLKRKIEYMSAEDWQSLQQRLEAKQQVKGISKKELERIERALDRLKEWQEASPEKKKEMLVKVDTAKDDTWRYLLAETSATTVSYCPELMSGYDLMTRKKWGIKWTEETKAIINRYPNQIWGYRIPGSEKNYLLYDGRLYLADAQGQAAICELAKKAEKEGRTPLQVVILRKALKTERECIVYDNKEYRITTEGLYDLNKARGNLVTIEDHGKNYLVSKADIIGETDKSVKVRTGVTVLLAGEPGEFAVNSTESSKKSREFRKVSVPKNLDEFKKEAGKNPEMSGAFDLTKSMIAQSEANGVNNQTSNTVIQLGK